MARSFAKIMLSTWDENSDFETLSMEAQWLYWVLLSHPLLSPAGVLPLQPRKWARRASNGDRDAVEDALRELVGKAKIVVDDDTEEVLIRTFIRHDGGAKNPNIHKAIVAAVGRIESPKLRDIAAASLAAASRKDQRTDPDGDRTERRPGDHDEHQSGDDPGRHPESTWSLEPGACHLEPEPANCEPSSSEHVFSSAAPNGSTTTKDPRLETVLGLIADRQIADHGTPNPIDPDQYRGRVLNTLIRQHGDRIRDFLAARPDHSAQLCADALALEIA